MRKCRHLVIFGIIMLLSSIIYFLGLNYLMNNDFIDIYYIGLFFGCFGLTFLSGAVLGNLENKRKSRADLGIVFHSIAFFTVISVWTVMTILLGLAGLKAVFGSFIGWGIGLLIHYYFSKQTLKGYNKDEVFE